MSEIRINGLIVGDFNSKNYRAVVNGVVYSAFEFITFCANCGQSVYVNNVKFN